MELKVQIPFKQLLVAIKRLPVSQLEQLKRELNRVSAQRAQNEDAVDLLLNGPVYTDKDIELIEQNRKSIAAWRTED